MMEKLIAHTARRSPRLLAAALGSAFALLLAFSAMAAAEVKYEFSFGSEGTAAGQFLEPASISQNTRPVTSTSPIVRTTASRSSTKTRTSSKHGALTSSPAAPDDKPFVSEVQRITIKAVDGTFSLTFGANTTPPLAYNATAGTVETALNALPSINTGGGSVTVSRGSWRCHRSQSLCRHLWRRAGRWRSPRYYRSTARGWHGPSARSFVQGNVGAGDRRRDLRLPLAAKWGADRRRDRADLHDDRRGLRQDGSVRSRSDARKRRTVPARVGDQQRLRPDRLDSGAGAPTSTGEIASPSGSALIGAPSGHLTCNAGTWQNGRDELQVPVVRALRRTRRRHHRVVAPTNSSLSEGDIGAGAIFQCKVTATNAGGSTVMWSDLRLTEPHGPPQAASSASNSPETEVSTAGRDEHRLDQGQRRRSVRDLQGGRHLQGGPCRAEHGAVLETARCSRRQLAGRQRCHLRRGRPQLPDPEAHGDRCADPCNWQRRQPGDGRQSLRHRLR